jgi:PelA/Pel-15E family pectate lyase
MYINPLKRHDMKIINTITAIAFVWLSISSISAQNTQNATNSYLSKSWNYVATKMPDEWYASDEAKLVAENVLLSQKAIGGWEKNKPYHLAFTKEEKAHYTKDKSEIGATFDNGATTTELLFLAKVNAKESNEKYITAFKKGLEYIFISQYESGGWPQFYPLKGGYADHITYNDDNMANIMGFLKAIIDEKEAFESLKISTETRIKAQNAFDKGIACLLKTQIIIDGKPTVWCAQHDEITFAPADARAYELASFSGKESVGLTLLLMNIENPPKEIIAAVKGAMEWFESNKIEGIKIIDEVKGDGKKNRIVVEDQDAPAIWARFYDLKTNEPYFCDRDGIKRKTLAELSDERRNGYGWYTNTPAKVLKKYPEWVKKWGEQ